MPSAFVQKVTGNGATVVLNGVGAGNALFLLDSWFRTSTTGAAEATPTDSNGTFHISNANAPIFISSAAVEAGVGIFDQQGAASGTHTVTPQANSGHNTTLCEFSGLVTSSMFDTGTSAKSVVNNHTSQATGTTPTTAQSDELVLICCAIVAHTGSSNVGWTDPVTTFTTRQIVINSATDIATHHSSKNVAAVSTQTATELWIATEGGIGSMACIATFKASGTTASAALSMIFPSSLAGMGGNRFFGDRLSYSVLSHYG